MNSFVKEILSFLEHTAGLQQSDIEPLIEIPPSSDMGDYAFPCYSLAQQEKKGPQAIAQQISAQFKPTVRLTRCQAFGPYVNFFVDQAAYIKETLTEVIKKGTDFGKNTQGHGRKVLIEFSSPNIAKPFGIGHLRSTIIGAALKRIYEALGYECIGLNYLGDWGTQFGKLITAFQHWGGRYSEEGDSSPCGLGMTGHPEGADLCHPEHSSRHPEPKAKDLLSTQKLYELYVRFHKEAENNPTLEDEARKWFRKCEQKDQEALSLWKEFKEATLAEFERIYQELGVQFDHIEGESDYSDDLPHVLKLAEKAKAEISDGALIVNLEAFGLPPALLRKKDGSTLYMTRDIAAALKRHEKYRFDLCCYVVGEDQKLHFNQLFQVLKLMGHEWADNCHHVPFGLIRFKDRKMSTRRGETIFLEDVLKRSEELVLEIIQQKNPDLPNKERVAKQIGIGGLIFGDLSSRRIKTIVFDWDQMLNPEGDTGPYVNYTYARACSVFRKSGLQKLPTTWKPELLKTAEEFLLVKSLEHFPRAISIAAASQEPFVISRYLLDICKLFNRFYYEHKILESDPELRAARLILTESFRTTLGNGMKLIGLPLVEEI